MHLRGSTGEYTKRESAYVLWLAGRYNFCIYNSSILGLGGISDPFQCNDLAKRSNDHHIVCIKISINWNIAFYDVVDI